jgi:hypothetical protein
MNASSLLLTHFSQRYPMMPKVKDAMRPENVVIAFDLMAVPLSEFRNLNLYASTIKRVCREQRTLSSEQEFELEN